jgi:hypothetical protein
MSYRIDVELSASEERSEFEITVTSSDGYPLTSQEILDAVSEALLHYFAQPVPDNRDDPKLHS